MFTQFSVLTFALGASQTVVIVPLSQIDAWTERRVSPEGGADGWIQIFE